MENDAWLDDPEDSMFWFNQWLAQFPANYNDLPIWAGMVNDWVRKELGIYKEK